MSIDAVTAEYLSKLRKTGPVEDITSFPQANDAEGVSRLQSTGELDASEALKRQAVLDRESRRQLRHGIAGRVLHTLWAQLIFLGILILLQGLGCWGFKLNEWIFGLFVNGVLIQTFFLARTIVEHLYPKDGSA